MDTSVSTAVDAVAPSDALESIRARVKHANINDRTLLATDYLNHFNEIVMLMDMIPDMPECLGDAAEWSPKSYKEHFRESSFSDKDLAIEAYDHAPSDFRVPFEATVAQMDRLVAVSLERISSAVDSLNDEAIREAASRASRDLQKLIDVVSAIINGSTPTIRQDEIDAMLGH